MAEMVISRLDSNIQGGEYIGDRKELQRKISCLLNETIIQEMISSVSTEGVHGRDFEYTILKSTDSQPIIVIYGDEGKRVDLDDFVENIANPTDCSPREDEHDYLAAALKLKALAKAILDNIDTDSIQSNDSTISTKKLAYSDYEESSVDTTDESSGSSDFTSVDGGDFVAFDQEPLDYPKRQDKDEIEYLEATIADLRADREDLLQRLEELERDQKDRPPVDGGEDRAALYKAQCQIHDLTDQLERVIEETQDLTRRKIHFEELLRERTQLLKRRDVELAEMEEEIERQEAEHAVAKTTLEQLQNEKRGLERRFETLERNLARAERRKEGEI